jgi:hypothetical protein
MVLQTIARWIVTSTGHTKGAPGLAFETTEPSKVIRLWLRPIGLEKHASAAKAVKRQAVYGTAEAVPFVKSFFPIWLKPSPTLKACPSAFFSSRYSRALKEFPIQEQC